MGRGGTWSSAVSRKITFLCPKWVSGVTPTCVHSQPRKATMSGFLGSPARALHCRMESFVSCQWRGEMASAWSLMLQKSNSEQKRAKSQASAGGCAPSPWSMGRLRTKASAEKVVWTWRSPKRICLVPASAAAPRVATVPRWASARAVRSAAGTRALVGVPGPSSSPRHPAKASAATATIRPSLLMAARIHARVAGRRQCAAPGSWHCPWTTPMHLTGSGFRIYQQSY